jgi:hypothetical protein
MRAAFLKNRANGLLLASLAVSALLGVTSSVQAAPAKPKKPVAAVTGTSEIPRAANGKPDFSGIWQTLSEADYDLEPHAGRRDAPPSAGVIEGGQIPYLPKALATKTKNFDARGKDDPRLKCWSLGIPRSVYYPAPFQIFQRDRDLTLIHQLGHQVRTIHTNDTLHQEGAESNFWLGDSRGHWEGDTLVVDVTELNDETWLDRAGNYHSEDLHVVERWSFIDKNTISYSATIDDKSVFSRPWTIHVVLNRREKGFELIEDYCYTLPYEGYYPPKEGK